MAAAARVGRVEETDMLSWFPEEFSPRVELDPTDALIPRSLLDDGTDDPDEEGDPTPGTAPLDTRSLHWTQALLEACQGGRPAED
jgi:hypothetical protein